MIRFPVSRRHSPGRQPAGIQSPGICVHPRHQVAHTVDTPAAKSGNGFTATAAYCFF